MIDVIYAPLIYESMALLSSSYMGQLFALFHHPVDRIASVVKVTQEMYPDLYGRDTLEQFLQANPNNDNWMTRNLAGGQLGAVDEKQYQIARDVLRSKGLVGLSTDLNGAVERVIRYFNWGNRITDQSKFQQCVIDETKKDESTPDGLYFGLYPEGSLEWNITVQHNYYDMRLYEFALTLYAEQGSSASTLATGYDSKNTISSIAKSGTSSGESATTTPSSSSSVSNGGAQSCDFVIGLLLFVITSILILDVRAA